jgi:hypothetical protein
MPVALQALEPWHKCWHAGKCPGGVDMPWVPYLISVSGLMAGIAGELVGLFSLARLVMVISRDWLLPPVLAGVYPRTQTPIVAQCSVGAIVGESAPVHERHAGMLAGPAFCHAKFIVDGCRSRYPVHH